MSRAHVRITRHEKRDPANGFPWGYDPTSRGDRHFLTVRPAAGLQREAAQARQTSRQKPPEDQA